MSKRTSSLYLSHSGDILRRSDSSIRMKPPTWTIAAWSRCAHRSALMLSQQQTEVCHRAAVLQVFFNGEPPRGASRPALQSTPVAI